MDHRDSTHPPKPSSPPAGATPQHPKDFAQRAMAGSKLHLGVSVLLTLAIAVTSALVGATAVHLGAVGAMGVFLVSYNLLRIRAARGALRSAQAGNDFVG